MEEQKSCQFEDCDVKTWRSKLTLIISIFSLFFLYINSGGAGKKNIILYLVCHRVKNTLIFDVFFPSNKVFSMLTEAEVKGGFHFVKKSII